MISCGAVAVHYTVLSGPHFNVCQGTTSQFPGDAGVKIYGS